MTLIVGIDSSMSSAGVARIHVDGETSRPWVTVHRVQSKPTTDDLVSTRSTRLRRIAQQVCSIAAGAAGDGRLADLVVIEAPLYSGKSTGSAHDRAGLWWMIAGRLTGAGLTVAEVTNTKVKKYATGYGSGPNSGKDRVLAETIRRYGHLVDVRGNDEADALVLAAIGARHLGVPIDYRGDTEPYTPGSAHLLTKNHLAALPGIEWPVTNPT